MKEQTHCPICKSQYCKEMYKKKVKYPEGDIHSDLLDLNFIRNKILFDEILKNRNPKEFCFKVCMNCGLIFFSPRPDEADMAIKYRIADELGGTEKRERFRHVRNCVDKRAFKMHKAISNMKHIQNANVVDVGGATGLNLKYFLGTNECYVVDYQKRNLIDGVKYLCKTTKDIPNSIHFAAVLFTHTLEHVVDPVEVILDIKSILEPNGILYIEVPFDCFKEYPHVRNFMTHINFFSEGSLWHLLDMCGLNIKYLKAKPNIANEGYIRGIVAIAENITPHNKKVNGYNITCKQMKRQYWLWLYAVLLTLWLKKFGSLGFILRRIKRMRQAKRRWG